MVVFEEKRKWCHRWILELLFEILARIWGLGSLQQLLIHGFGVSIVCFIKKEEQIFFVVSRFIGGFVHYEPQQYKSFHEHYGDKIIVISDIMEVCTKFICGVESYDSGSFGIYGSENGTVRIMGQPGQIEKEMGIKKIFLSSRNEELVSID
ncbi:hypothetical protein CTI12_AA101340 [Artemisia annua]|uniref:Uncharacterized protein n=1 Tax=Artemisia annua TaxID=35608 RepID=A0A2U1PX33_ARTAN|nr:hypothetical protein CTI12_AA101340 [Artemisia annua]